MPTASAGIVMPERFYRASRVSICPGLMDPRLEHAGMTISRHARPSPVAGIHYALFI
jgi:hypothetical protein